MATVVLGSVEGHHILLPMSNFAGDISHQGSGVDPYDNNARYGCLYSLDWTRLDWTGVTEPTTASLRN